MLYCAGAGRLLGPTERRDAGRADDRGSGLSCCHLQRLAGILAPFGTPAPILEKVRQEVAAILAEGTLRQRLTDLGAERILANTPAEAKAYVEAEMARWEGVLRDAGVRPQ